MCGVFWLAVLVRFQLECPPPPNSEKFCLNMKPLNNNFLFKYRRILPKEDKFFLLVNISTQKYLLLVSFLNVLRVVIMKFLFPVG